MSVYIMKRNTWRKSWRPAHAVMHCITLTMAIVTPTAIRAQDSAPIIRPAETGNLSFKEAFDAAWQRSLEASEARGRQVRAQADQAVSQSWLAGTPSVRVGQREGWTGAPSGSRETELGVALPVRAPGQYAAGVQAAQSQSTWAIAVEESARLQLAGRLREAIAALHLAEVEMEQTQRRADTLKQLAQDVQRRVVAGDLAPADAMAARSEWLSAEAQTGEARQALSAQQAQWYLLTGLPPLQQKTSEPPTQTQVPDSHPELRLADAALDWGQRRLDLARVSRTDSPEISVGTRQEKPGQGIGAQNTVVVALRVPIAGELYQQPRIATAQGELDMAQTQSQRVRERLAAQFSLAQGHLRQSIARLQVEQERAALLSERARLIDKSFRAGETALPEMLRSLAAASHAQTEHARQQINHQLAIARLEQALGILP